MTKSEYQELVEFLGPKFENIDQRFEKIDQRFERLEKEVSRVGVVAEENRDLIRKVAEYTVSISARLDRVRDALDHEAA